MLSNDVRKVEQENEQLKEALRELSKKLAADQIKPKACEYCKFYAQHYVKVSCNYAKTYCGHCTHGRIKERKPDNTCKYFELGKWEIKNI